MNDLSAFQSFAVNSNNSNRKGTDTVIYTRVSSSGQEDNTSLESQKRYCEQFASKRGLTIVDYFGGSYESAKSDERKEFKKMLAYVKRNKRVSHIIVYSYDRFSRTGVDGAKIADDLFNEYGIITLAVKQEIDPSTPAGSFQQKIFFLFSQFDNELRRDKCMTGMKEQVRNGYWCWVSPLGYTNLNKGQKASNHKLVVNDEGKLLKKAFEWKAKGMSGVQIIKKLKTLGLKVTDKKLSQIFRNPFYCGLIVSSLAEGEVIEGKHQPLISQDLFLKVNHVLNDKPAKENPKTENENLPLRVFVKCGKCGTPLTGYLMRKKNIHYYKCRKKGCKSNRNANDLHVQFKETLSWFCVDKNDMPFITTVLKKITKEVFKEDIEDKKRLVTSMGEVQKKLDSIEERFVVGEIDRELYIKYSDKYKKERGEIQSELNKKGNGSSNHEKLIEFAVEVCTKLQSLWELSDFYQKQALQRMIFPNGIYYNREDDVVRTDSINTLFAIIPQLSKSCVGDKKGKNLNSNKFFPLVGPPGLEPGTP